jgi:hypothetical protein
MMISDGDPNSMVDHPKHYNAHPSGVECIDVVRHYNFNVGNAIKYLWRAGLKNVKALMVEQVTLEDLRKAQWYIADEIARVEKQYKEQIEEWSEEQEKKKAEKEKKDNG